jgi:hypothetical protein
MPHNGSRISGEPLLKSFDDCTRAGASRHEPNYAKAEGRSVEGGEARDGCGQRLVRLQRLVISPDGTFTVFRAHRDARNQDPAIKGAEGNEPGRPLFELRALSLKGSLEAKARLGRLSRQSQTQSPLKATLRSAAEPRQHQWRSIDTRSQR